MIVSEKIEITGFEIEHMCCDICGTKMERCGDLVLTTYPPSFKYRCEKCGKNYVRQGLYPRYWLLLKTGDKVPYGSF